MNQKRRSTDPEMAALGRLVRIVDALSVAERDRVLAFLFDRYEMGDEPRRSAPEVET